MNNSVDPNDLGSVSGNVIVNGSILLGLALALFVIYYCLSLKKFRKDYTRLASRLDGFLDERDTSADGVASPGQSYVLASRGPAASRDAEMQSADARWRHMAMAFPHLSNDLRTVGSKRPLFLVSRKYTQIDAVDEMQMLISARVRAHFKDLTVDAPSWVEYESKDFDALRHPELAIANPAIYTFPFLLTWQRRHQWGVLPYATHTRLGVLVKPGHPCVNGDFGFGTLAAIEEEYAGALKKADESGLLLWANDPRFARWLTMLIAATKRIGAVRGEEYSPCRISRDDSGLVWNADMASAMTVFSVGAYLHKELLPLASAGLADAQTAALYANYARELLLPDLPVILEASRQGDWNRNSAIIIDLAEIPEGVEEDGWKLFHLPHCVYVPIGIGFSVATVPLLGRNWRNELLADAGELLEPEREPLRAVGIDVDPRLWSSDMRKES